MHRASPARCRARWGRALVAVLVGGGALVGTGPLLAAPAGAATPSCQDPEIAGANDINGDGFKDVVIGDPAATADGVSQAGQIVVRYGSEAGPGIGGRVETLPASSLHDRQISPNDHFGAVIATGLVDEDHCLDVVVGVPDAGPDDTGLALVAFGSERGLGQGDSAWVVDSEFLQRESAPGDRTGAALAVIDYGEDKPEYSSIAIGIPGRDVGTAADAGAVAIANYTTSGGGMWQLHEITQDRPGVTGAAEAKDAFGSSVAFGHTRGGERDGWIQDLIVGVPGENDGAGMIVTVESPTASAFSHESQGFSQNTAGVDGSSEAGDRFGESLSHVMDGITGTQYLAVGAPREDISGATDAGMVHLFRYGTPLSGQDETSVHQGTAGVPGANESGDRFGATLLVTDYWSGAFGMALVVGVPYENGAATDSGSIVMMNARVSLLGNGARALSQNSAGIPGAAEAKEHFGAALGTSGPMGSLLIGVPDDIGYPKGVVIAVPWVRAGGLTSDAATAWTPAAGIRFGAAIG